MDKDWKDLERVVQLIEQSISPEAVVEHNQFLPVIGSPSGLKRQCDVVVRSGDKPREVITIIEVQNRTSKPDITTFGGWLEKLDEVGAHQRFCRKV